MQRSNFIQMKRKRPTQSVEKPESSVWADKYEPTTVKEIGVSKPKITQVQKALVNHTIKLLILAGPTGCGKSTLIKLLCRQIGFEVTEWITPERNWSSKIGHMEAFRQFMDKAIGFQTLDRLENKKKVILMDDVPDLLHETGKEDYVSILQNCLNSSKKFLIVLIASDAIGSRENTGFSRMENHARVVAPESLKSDPRVEYIENKLRFNPITQINMLKILSSIKNAEEMSIPQHSMNSLIQDSNGDIRSAINRLQFISNQVEKEQSTTVSTSSSKVVEFDKHVSKLSLFHAVGKVLYAKRNPDQTLESKPDHIMNKLPVDHDLFIDYIHQNCIGFFQDIESCSDALDEIGFADALRSEFDWLDKSSAEYRNYITIYGIMKNRKSTERRFNKLAGTEFRKLKYETRKKRYQAYEEIWLESVKQRNSYAINNDADEFQKKEAEVVDEDDEDEMYDKMFGDGSELIELDF